MKTLILLILFIYGFSYPQADLIIPITISFDNTFPIQYLQIGLDSTATDSVDEHLGEISLPSIPPPGWPVVFILPGNTDIVHKDFRFGELPFTGVKEHRIGFLDGATISWELPNGASGQLVDLFGGVIINVPMNGFGSYYASNFAINELKMIMTYNNVTPVELVSFTASLSNSGVQLNWETASETNNSGFEILRFAQNGKGWEKIGFVNGFGTTIEAKTYSFTDENVSVGIYKYRLKQVDYDGTFNYSNEIEIDVNSFPEEFVLEQNYPNPFNPITKIKFSFPSNVKGEMSKVSLKVYDLLGNVIALLINEEKPGGKYSVSFDASKLSSGIYFYSLSTDNFHQTKKMILAK